MDPTNLESTCTVALPGGAPEWVHLMTPGPLNAIDGRKWNLKDPAGVVEASRRERVDLVIDYDHLTDLVKDTGRKSPAAGWIKELEVRSDGIWAKVEWTQTAAEHLRQKEYRYLSPTFLHAKDGTVVKILRAALTNNPALTLTALASANDEDTMKEMLKQFAAALGLPADADQETVLAAVKVQADAAKGSADTMKAVCTALDLKDDAGAKEIAAAIAKLGKAGPCDGGNDPDPAKFVSMAAFQEVADELGSLKQSLATDKATAAVEKAMAEGKVSPAMKDWAASFAAKDLEAFNEFAKKQPVIVDPAPATPASAPARGDGSLTDADKAVCAQLGLDEAAFVKTREMEIAR